MNQFGEYVPPDKQHHWLENNQYRTLRDVTGKAVDTELSCRDVHREINILQNIRYIVSDLSRRDVLHTMRISVLHHLQNWIFDLINRHEWLDKYNPICLSMPAYPDLTPKICSMRKFLNGIERR
jgi:hypothetical protein